jgi:hypothetical protein
MDFGFLPCFIDLKIQVFELLNYYPASTRELLHTKSKTCRIDKKKRLSHF